MRRLTLFAAIITSTLAQEAVLPAATAISNQDGFTENAEISRSCDIPNQSDKGLCVVISECEKYLELRNSSNVISAEKVNFLKRIQCEGRDVRPHVCCPFNDSAYENPKVPFSRFERKVRAEMFVKGNTKKHKKRTEILQEPYQFSADNEECGKQVVNRIYGGEIAELDEYPWMALLVYNSNEFGCAGALISRRYVLTAAHCVTGSVFEEKKGLKSVRLGEYNTNTEPDCIQEISHLDCADSAIDIGIESVIVHPEYNALSRNMQNDIALIRLERLHYTHFIMPICLPTHNSKESTTAGNMFTVAGWGRTNLFNKFRWNMASPIKLKLHVPIVDNENCSTILKPYGVRLSSKQICAGGEISRDTCLGDSGGPLMRFDEKMLKWVTHGVVSYGFTQCGIRGYPAIYTNVAEYIDWILAAIKT